jgi:hypothetical protein
MDTFKPREVLSMAHKQNFLAGGIRVSRKKNGLQASNINLPLLKAAVVELIMCSWLNTLTYNYGRVF